MDAKARGMAIWRKMRQFDRGLCVSIDATAFDTHNRAYHLQGIHRVYTSCFDDPELKALLEAQLLNRARTKGGVQYVVEGRRMSGDMDTAAGNCLLSLLNLSTVMRRLRDRKWDALLDGDDVLLFVESRGGMRNRRFRRLLLREYGKLGFDIRKSEMTEEIEKIDFCQSVPACYGPGDWRMVPNPKKTTANMCASHKLFNEPKWARRALRTVAQGWLAAYPGAPITQALATRILRATADVRLVSLKEVGFRHVVEDNWAKAREEPVSTGARMAVETGFGVSLQDQMACERAIEALPDSHFHFDVLTETGPELLPTNTLPLTLAPMPTLEPLVL
jgi:hypothetical protein